MLQDHNYKEVFFPTVSNFLQPDFAEWNTRLDVVLLIGTPAASKGMLPM